MPYFGVCQQQNPWVDFQKNLQGWLRRGPNTTCKYWGQSVQRQHVCMKLSPSVVYFFSFLGLMRFATGRPVGPIVAVNGSDDASWWPSRPSYGFVNKYFSLFFTQKCEKLNYTLWELWTAITLASLKICTSCLHQTGFSGLANLMVSFKLTPNSPCCHGNQSLLLNTKFLITPLV